MYYVKTIQAVVPSTMNVGRRSYVATFLSL